MDTSFNLELCTFRVNVALHFAKKSLFNAVKIYKLKLEYKSEAANTTCIIYDLIAGAV